MKARLEIQLKPAVIPSRAMYLDIIKHNQKEVTQMKEYSFFRIVQTIHFQCEKIGKIREAM